MKFWVVLSWRPLLFSKILIISSVYAIGVKNCRVRDQPTPTLSENKATP